MRFQRVPADIIATECDGTSWCTCLSDTDLQKKKKILTNLSLCGFVISSQVRIISGRSSSLQAKCQSFPPHSQWWGELKKSGACGSLWTCVIQPPAIQLVKAKARSGCCNPPWLPADPGTGPSVWILAQHIPSKPLDFPPPCRPAWSAEHVSVALVTRRGETNTVVRAGNGDIAPQ